MKQINKTQESISKIERMRKIKNSQEIAKNEKIERMRMVKNNLLAKSKSN
jgi:hypothetical protein